MSARKAPRRPQARKLVEVEGQHVAPRDVIHKRLVAQQRRLYQMAGICQVSTIAAGDACQGAAAVDDAARQQFTESAWSALELVASMLMEIASDIDPVVLLKPAEVAT